MNPVNACYLFVGPSLRYSVHCCRGQAVAGKIYPAARVVCAAQLILMLEKSTSVNVETARSTRPFLRISSPSSSMTASKPKYPACDKAAARASVRCLPMVLLTEFQNPILRHPVLYSYVCRGPGGTGTY